MSEENKTEEETRQEPEKKRVKKKKPQKPSGKYIVRAERTELDSQNKKRALFMLLSTLLLAVSLFIPQDNMFVLAKIVWLNTAYAIFMCGLIAISVWTSYASFRGAKLRTEIPETDAPRKGFEHGTFRCYEWFVIFHTLWAAAQIALTVWKFDAGGLIITLLAAASLAFAIIARQISFNALKGKTEYLPPAAPLIPENEQDENGENGNKDENDNPNEEMPETEDFYGEAPDSRFNPDQVSDSECAPDTKPESCGQPNSASTGERAADEDAVPGSEKQPTEQNPEASLSSPETASRGEPDSKSAKLKNARRRNQGKSGT